jgi:long-chain acyl-CoA synthetase
VASTREEALARLIGPGGPFEIRREVVLGVQVRAYQVGPHTLAEVLEASRVWGNRDYLVYDDERYTYEQHYDVVAGLAHHLAENYGIGPGDRIVIAMRNYPEFPLFFWAAQALGAVAVLLNAWWTEPELRFGLDDSEGVFLVVDRERLERMQRIIPAASRLRERHHPVWS